VAGSLHISEAAVKQHLSRLYDKFAITQGGNRRAALLEEAVRLGAISLGEVGSHP
jgi:DNA-binding CsgD family transcriptional regulator